MSDRWSELVIVDVGYSFAPLVLGYFWLFPTACAEGCILAPLCGWEAGRVALRGLNQMLALWHG